MSKGLRPFSVCRTCVSVFLTALALIVLFRDLLASAKRPKERSNARAFVAGRRLVKAPVP